MNREVKFRAWDTQDKEMYYDVQRGISFEDGSHYSFDNFLGNQEADDYHKWEIMQYTGLKDKNGKEIYEGDICVRAGKAINKCPFVIEWGIDQCDGWTGFWISPGGIEVIGNIYKNPELLNQTNNE